jgi:hypothetical protein
MSSNVKRWEGGCSIGHEAYLESIRKGDGRRWNVEEVNGVSTYTPIYGSGADDGVDMSPDAVAYRKARQKLTDRTGKPGRPFTWRLGYNHCIGQFSPADDDIPSLSGSSLNRKKKPAKPAKKNAAPAVHFLGARSRGKIKDKMTAFFRSVPRDRVFLTLTFIEHVDDREGVRILNKFLTVVRRERPGFEYIWVAEHQPDRKEKTIHFHMLINKKLAVARYNSLWVLQQYNAGLVGHRKGSGEEIPRAEVEAHHNRGTMHKVLGPAQMRNAKTVHGLALYLANYVSKQDAKEPFGCLNWHCSRKISKLFTRAVVTPSTFAYLNSFTNWKIDKRTGECSAPKVIQQQFFTMIYVHNKGAPLPRLKELETINKWIINDLEPDKVREIHDTLYREKKREYEHQQAMDTVVDLRPRIARMHGEINGTVGGDADHSYKI